MLTVDPGFHTGVAYWKDGLLRSFESFNVSTAKAIKTDEDRLRDMWKKFDGYLQDLEFDVSICYIEGVEAWGGSLKSRTAGARGDLSKLAYLVGGFCFICLLRDIEFKVIKVREWKGNLPKSVVESRVRKGIIGLPELTNEHTIDAIGIGLSKLGRLQ
jgi:hypothetical protein